MYCAVLCCVVLCCAVLCCAVLCCAVLCCAVPAQCVRSGGSAVIQTLLSPLHCWKLCALSTAFQPSRCFPSRTLSVLTCFLSLSVCRHSSSHCSRVVVLCCVVVSCVVLCYCVVLCCCVVLLCCAVLCCAVLCCAVLCCVVLCCAETAVKILLLALHSYVSYVLLEQVGDCSRPFTLFAFLFFSTFLTLTLTHSHLTHSTLTPPSLTHSHLPHSTLTPHSLHTHTSLTHTLTPHSLLTHTSLPPTSLTCHTRTLHDNDST